MAEEKDFQRGYGLAQGYTANGWEGQGPDQFVDSANKYLANITHDGENWQYQELLSEFKTLRKWL